MKATLNSTLRALALGSCVLWFAGCETEAEDAAATNVPPAIASATNLPVDGANAATTAPAPTNSAAAGTNATTAVTNEQTVIVNEVEPTLPAGLKLSKGVEEVVELAQSGVSETVMLLFVEKSQEPFDLDAAEILYLNDIGIPQTVIASMLNHDGAPQELKNVLNDSENAVATALPASATAPAAPDMAAAAPALPPPPMQVTSNFVADPNYQAPQQPVVVQQQPVVVQQPVVIQQPVVVQPAVTHSYFYSSLAPYGSWVEVADYGWCWQPTVAVVHRGWRPYAHGGRWLHSDHGWYWHSDYSWGWAPFHYGRWHVAGRHGWVWVPDYTWGPSWVTWRYSGGYCGWAPLPPRAYVRPGFGFRYYDRDVGFSFSFGYTHEHYTFVPTRHFHHRRPIDHVVPTEKTVNIYKDSTVVNNYIVGNNNTIVNGGISRDRIASHSRTEIPRVRIQEVSSPVPPGTPGATVQPDRIHKRGQEMVVYRPKTPPAPAAALAENGPARNAQEPRRPGGEPGRPLSAPASVASAPAPNPAGPRLGQEVRRPSTLSPASADLPAGSRIAARRQPESALPAPAAPPPIRPEAAPVFTPSVRSSRAVQEAARPAAPLASSPAASQAISPRPSSRFGSIDATPMQPQSSRPSVGAAVPGSRPSAPFGSSGFGAQPSGSPALSGPAAPAQARPVAPAQNSRSGTQMPSSISGVPSSSVRPDLTVRPAAPAQNSRFGSQPAMPPSISGQAVPGSSPNSISSRPAAPVQSQSSRFGGAAPAAPPSISGAEVPGAGLRSESRFNSSLGRQAVSPAAPQLSPPVVVPQQPRATVAPGAIQGGSRFGAPAPAAPATVLNPRSESLNRSATPSYQPSTPQVVQPRSVTPVRPQSVAPAPSSRFGSQAPAAPPAARSGPAPQINSAPINSGSSRFGSAPPAAARAPVQIQRPSAPAPAQTPQGRGRIEIGR
jgi:hypothetical protein